MANLNLNNSKEEAKGEWRRESIYMYHGHMFKRCRLIDNLCAGFQWYLCYFDVQGTKRIPAPEWLCSVFMNLKDAKAYIIGLEKYRRHNR